ncbi:hypothetical protein E4H12_02965 [Candidatus Thorarchaeota archaeon]|nr:MAG: hypothetical protein E4H12_02965 [Candidatus Thorarchaeota archaeon]
MAFEDGLGTDPSHQRDNQYYSLSAYDIMARTISLWSRKIIQYITIVGIIGAVCVAFSFILLNSLFGLIGIIEADPLSYLVTLLLDSVPDFMLIVVTVGFAFFAFVLTAITSGAAIKFTLDEYGGDGGNVGTSFSHSFGRVLNIIILQIILSFFVAITLTPATILTTQALDMIDISDFMNPIFPPGSIELLMEGMGLFIVGGIFLIYINVRFAPALAIVIDTDLSAIDSLKRSWELTSGSFFHVFGSYILLNVAVLILGAVVTIVLSFTFLPDAYLFLLQPLVSALLFSALSYIFTAVLYRDLSSRSGTSNLPSFLG